MKKISLIQYIIININITFSKTNKMELVKKYEELQNEDCSCMLCNNKIKQKYSLFLLKCGHTFHNACIYKYATRQNNCCPKCKMCSFYESSNLLRACNERYDLIDKTNILQLTDCINFCIASAIQGYGPAQYKLLYFLTKYYNNYNNETIIKWLEFSSENNFEDAHNALAMYYEKGIIVKKDINKALYYHEKLVNMNPNKYYDSALFVAKYYIKKGNIKENKNKDKIPPEDFYNIKKGFNYLKHAIDNENDEALYIYSKFYYYGIIIKKNITTTYNILLKLTNKNYPDAICNLAKMYYDGIHVKKNIKKSIELFEKASYFEHPTALYYLGMYYFDIDKEKSFKYFLRNAENNNPESQYVLSQFYFKGLIDKVDEISGFNWLKKSVINGYPKGALYLAHCYENSIGTVQSNNNALLYYKIAADNGDSEGIKGVQFYSLFNKMS